MRDHDRTARRMIATGAIVLVVTLAALGAAARVLVGREEASEREQSRRALEAVVVRWVVTCMTTSRDTSWMTVDVDRAGEFERPAARPFAPLPTTDDGGGGFGPTAADRIRGEAERSGDPRLRRAWAHLMLAAEDPVVRLDAAVRGAMLEDEEPARSSPARAPAHGTLPPGTDAWRNLVTPLSRDWRTEARIPPELSDTAEAVLLGVRAGDATAIDRAWQAVGSADETRAVAMLVRWPHTDPPGEALAVTSHLRRVRRWLDDRAVVARVAQSLPVRDLTVPGGSPNPRARVALLAEGSWIEGVERDDGGWRYIRRVDPRAVDDLTAGLAKDGVRLIRRDPPADAGSYGPMVPLDVGWAAVWATPRTTTGRAGLLAIGLAVAAAAALLAFAVFARAVRRETAAAAARADFVATASHELRTPIAVMRTAAETLLAGRAPRDEDRATLLRAVLRESERLSSLVGNLLDFSRMDAGTRRYSFRETDPVALVQDTVQRTASAFAGTGFRVEVDSDPSVGTLRADPDALGAALANLLDNAAKFRGASDHAVVRVRGDAATVTIDVEDHGIGIAPADRAHVFERFFRSSDPRVRETRGSGIGLALVRHAVEAHEGTIEIRDTPGGGTTIRIVLPKRGDPA